MIKRIGKYLFLLLGSTPAIWGLSRDQLAQELQRSIARRYAIPMQAVRVRPIHISRHLLHAQSIKVDLNRIPLRTGIQSFPCRRSSDNKLGYMTADVRIKLPVLVTTIPLHRGDTLKADVYQLRLIELSQAPDEYFRDPSEINGKVAANYIPSGKPLTRNSVMIPPLVRAGKPVTLTVRRKSLTLRLPAVALQTGRAGETVRVRIPQTGRLQTAVVTGPAQVELGTGRN